MPTTTGPVAKPKRVGSSGKPWAPPGLIQAFQGVPALQHGFKGPVRLVRHRRRRPPEGDNGVADDLVHRGPVVVQGVDHGLEVPGQVIGQGLRRHGFRDVGEAGNVGEENGQGLRVPADPGHLTLRHQFFDNFYGHVSGEGLQRRQRLGLGLT